MDYRSSSPPPLDSCRRYGPAVDLRPRVKESTGSVRFPYSSDRPIIIVDDPLYRSGVTTQESLLRHARTDLRGFVNQAVVLLGVMHDRHIASFDESRIRPFRVLYQVPR